MLEQPVQQTFFGHDVRLKHYMDLEIPNTPPAFFLFIHNLKIKSALRFLEETVKSRHMRLLSTLLAELMLYVKTTDEISVSSVVDFSTTLLKKHFIFLHSERVQFIFIAWKIYTQHLSLMDA